MLFADVSNLIYLCPTDYVNDTTQKVESKLNKVFVRFGKNEMISDDDIHCMYSATATLCNHQHRLVRPVKFFQEIPLLRRTATRKWRNSQ